MKKIILKKFAFQTYTLIEVFLSVLNRMKQKIELNHIFRMKFSNVMYFFCNKYSLVVLYILLYIYI